MPHFLHLVDRIRPRHKHRMGTALAQSVPGGWWDLSKQLRQRSQQNLLQPVSPSCCIFQVCSLQSVFCFHSQGRREVRKGADGPEGEELALGNAGRTRANHFTISHGGEGMHGVGYVARAAPGRPTDALTLH